MENSEIRTIIDAIRAATEVARPHYEYIGLVQNRVEKQLDKYLKNESFEELYKEVAKYDKKLAQQIEELMIQRNDIIEGMKITQREIFEEKLANRDNFTIMFFGRTMAGKSTTIQAFLAKNLAIHGNGTPDWTKEISVYDWNGVRLVDTPGIEGFDSSNFEIANNYIEQADMVLMVISDDHIEPNLIERMAALLKENKPFAVILNVKAGNPKIVLKRPEKVIRDAEVNGHVQRIREYLKREFSYAQSSQSISEIPIFPVYIEGAFRAQIELHEENISADNKELYEKLYQYSRFDEVVKYLSNNIVQNSSVIKARSVYDSFVYRFEEIEDVLRAKVYPLKKQTELLNQKRPKIKRDILRISEQINTDFYSIKEIFDSKIANVDTFVEKYIDDGAKGNLHKLYEKYLGWDEIKESVARYQGESIESINAYVSAFEEDMLFDLNIVSVNASREIEYELTIDTGKLSDARFKKVVGKVVKTVGRTAAGAAPAALIGWGVANFWNPTGWVSLAAAAGTLIIGGALGYYGSEGVKQLGNELDKSGDNAIAQEKATVVKEMKKDLLTNFTKLENKNKQWVNQTVSVMETKLLGGVDLSLKESNTYIRETFDLIYALSDIRKEVLKNEIEFVLSTILTVAERSCFNVHKVVRKVGRRIKIAVIPVANKKMDIVKLVLGNGNENIFKIRKNFGREAVNIVGLDDPMGNWGKKQVIEALGVKTVHQGRVNILEENYKKVVTISGCSKNELGLLYDKHKINRHLSQELLNCRMNFVEEYDENNQLQANL